MLRVFGRGFQRFAEVVVFCTVIVFQFRGWMFDFFSFLLIKLLFRGSGSGFRVRGQRFFFQGVVVVLFVVGSIFQVWILILVFISVKRWAQVRKGEVYDGGFVFDRLDICRWLFFCFNSVIVYCLVQSQVVIYKFQ